ncbi:anaerobic C4-dicarboxylate transporter family protein [Enterobacter hormaechei]
MAVASVASQMAITASPFPWPSFRWSRFWVRSTASVTRGGSSKSSPFPYRPHCLASPLRHCGACAGKNLADDTEFQEKLEDPKQREFIYGGTGDVDDQRFPKQAYWSTWIFFAGIAVVVLLVRCPSCVRR